MIIYISMFIVLALFYILHTVYSRNHNLKNKHKPSRVVAFIVFAYIIFWIGMRNHYIDTGVYIISFENAAWSGLSALDFSFNSGWGFDILEIFFHECISSNPQVWLMFLAIISGTLVGVTFYKYSQNFFYSVFIFLASTDFLWMMNGIRQFLVVSILFAATPLIEKGKTVKYILLVLACSVIHGTALLMIPVYFFVRAKPWKPRTLLLFTFVLFVLFFSSLFTDLLENIFKETKYENIREQFSQDDGAHPLRILVFSVTPILSFLARKRLPQDDILINVFVNMSLITLGLYLISMATSGILLGRLPIYTQLYQYMLLPHVIDSLLEKTPRTLVYMLSIVLFLLYFFIAAHITDLYYSSTLTGIIN